jgi:hypothetical protein
MTENWHQQQAVIWFRNQYSLVNSDPFYLIGSIPNDGKDRKEQMRKLGTGMLAGASDLFIVLNRQVLFVEMKTPEGRQSKIQKEIQKNVEKLGHTYLVCYGFEDFKERVLPFIIESDRLSQLR